MMDKTEQLHHRLAIANLVHRYALNIRRGRGADCADLFTADAVFEIREAHPAHLDAARVRKTLSGRDAIRDYILSSTGTGLLVCPIIHNLLVEVNGPAAQSNCLMTTRTWPAGHELIGEYHDAFRYETVWRFSSRVYTIFRQDGT